MANFTYIKLDIDGYYIEFDSEFDPNLYDNLGDSYQDFLENKWVLLSSEQVAFHVENPTASVFEVWNMKLIRTVEQAKAEMIQKIDEYDSSENVNGFKINGQEAGWFTPEERSNYRSSIDAAKLLGVSALTFFIGNIEMTVTLEQAEIMLAQIQLYADACYIVTKEHKVIVNELHYIDDVDNFPYTEGYPEKINFNYPF